MYPKLWAATGLDYTGVITALIETALTRTNGVLGN
jgi:D-alanine-D-alanine ligase